MATPPTWVSDYTFLPGNNTTPKNTGAIVSGSTGDVICGSVIEWNDDGSDNFTITSSPTETWTEGSETSGASTADVWLQPVYTALTAARSGMTITATRIAGTSSDSYGFIFGKFTGTEGIGATQRTTGNGQSAPSVTITTLYDNSAIFYIIANWSNDNNAARTHTTPSGGSTPVEVGHINNSTEGSATWAYVLDAGPAGAKTVGLSAPTGQDSLVVAIEVRGTTVTGPSFDASSFDSTAFYTSDASTTPVTKSYASTWTVNSQVSKTYSQTWNTRSTVAAKTYAGTWNVNTSLSKTYASTWNLRSQIAKAYGQTWNVAGALTSVSKTYANSWNVNTSIAKSYANTWNLYTAATAMYSVDWNLRGPITNTQTTTWNVAADTVANYYNITDAIGFTPPTAATTDSGSVNLGTEFYVTAAAWATKIRWWQPSTNSPSSTTRTVGIYRVDSDSTGTLVAGPFTSVVSGSGWQNVDLVDPLELTINQRYRVVVLHPNGQYASTPSTFVGADYVDGLLVIPMTANATGNDNGSYNYGSSLTFTTGSFNNTYYWSDVEVTDTNPTGLSSVTKTASSTWTVVSDKVYSFWPSDRAGWNSTPGTTYDDANTPGGSWGLVFAVSGSCEIGGVRWYAPVAKSGCHLYLGDGDSGVLYHDQDNYDISVGWNEIVFDTPYVASPGITYKILLWMPGNQNYTYTDDNRWSTGDNRAVGNIYSLVDGPSQFYYNQAEPTTTIPSGASGTQRWAAMDVIEVLPAEEVLDTTFGATVALENAKPGSPSTGWMITGAGDTGNIGYTGNYHYDKAIDTTVDFHCHGPGTKIDIYRLGFYQGHGARRVAQLTNTATTQGNASTIANSNGGIEFNWSTTATWTIPSDALSGFYFAVYRNPDETNASWIPFVLADRDRTASMAYKTSDFTWYGAYNYCGDLGSILTGKSVYGSGGPMGNIATRHFVSSYHRPLVTREGIPQTYWMNSESSTIMFLEEQGIDVKYTSCIGLDQTTTGLTNINLLLSSGHDEYWSTGMTDNVQTLRDQEDINLIFMSGNENFWRVFWDNTNKRMTCRKDTMSGPDSHVAGVPFIDEANWTGTWRDTRWSLRRPENETTGTWFDMNGVMDKTLVVDAATYGSHTVWRNTTVASGTNLSLPRVVGFEADSYMPTQPVGSYTLLAAQVFNIDGSKADTNGENYNLNGNLNYGIVAQRFNNNVVVGFGTCQWQWALIGTHDRTATTPNINARQMTLNLLADLGALPTTTTSGLITPTPQSLDNYGAATTTPVTKTSSSTWNVRAVLVKTQENLWNVRTALAKSYQNTWAVRAAVAKSYASAWNVAVSAVLLGEWGFLDNLLDSSGNTNNASATGFTPTYVSGPQPNTKAVKFTGTGQSIIYGRQPALYPTTVGITVMGWMRAPAAGWPNVDIGGLTKARSSGSTRAGFYLLANGKFRPLSRWKESLFFSDNLGVALNNGVWHHFAIVDGNTRSEWYIDGVSVGTSTRSFDNTPFDISTEAYDWKSGVDSALSLGSYDGLEVSGVRIFHGELSDSEVSAWMDTPIESDLVPVTKTSASTWNIRSAIAKSYGSVWNTRQAVTSTKASTWNVDGSIFTVTKSASSNWNVRAAIAPATNNNTWTVREVVNKAAVNSWAVRSVLSKASSSTWSVRSQVVSVKAGTWNVLARVAAKSYANTWTARAFVTDTNSVTWNARSLITKTSENLWDTEATGSVSSTYGSTWNVRQRLNLTKAQTWNIRTSLVTSKASTWAVRAIAAKSYVQTWNLRALATSTNASLWNVHVAVSRAANFDWAVRAPVGSVANFTWGVRGLAETEVPISWSVLEIVTDELPINWDIFVALVKSASNTWNATGQITRGYSNTWIVRENNKWYVKTDDGIVHYQLVGVWDGTQVVAI